MSRRSRWQFWAVNLGHMTNDLFMSTRSVLLAFMSAYVLPMTNREIGLALSPGELMGSLSQPLFGWLAIKPAGAGWALAAWYGWSSG
jgi:FSR family fosmidomycin resistance protein-like MFS transporter